MQRVHSHAVNMPPGNYTPPVNGDSEPCRSSTHCRLPPAQKVQVPDFRKIPNYSSQPMSMWKYFHLIPSIDGGTLMESPIQSSELANFQAKSGYPLCCSCCLPSGFTAYLPGHCWCRGSGCLKIPASWSLDCASGFLQLPACNCQHAI